MGIKHNFSLKDFNTFRIDVKAKKFLEVNSIEEVEKYLINFKIDEQICFLGAGSNILFIEDFEGLIVRPILSGVKIIDVTDDYVIIEASAGENWHSFVKKCINNNFFGLENLALIPGNVGGAIVQNIGAYAEEIQNFVLEVYGFDLKDKIFRILNKEECRFSYRNSIFKNQLKARFLILSAKFLLRKKPIVNVSYSDLQNELKKNPNIKPNPKWVFNTVCSIRKSKLPDNKKYPNAGSFFKNPIVDGNKIDEIKRKYPELVAFPVGNDNFKIPAGWLIEKAGWKGKRIGKVGTYEHHSLIIINFGVKTGKEILDFANLIRWNVKEKFDIELEFEVEIVNNNNNFETGKF
ncbi:MAG: UDP-N-acetylmuramate dehydrogenase [Candidatus Kapaibacteriales bacterium]